MMPRGSDAVVLCPGEKGQPWPQLLRAMGDRLYKVADQLEKEGRQ